MCLITNNRITKAKTDIICWKVFRKGDDNVYYSPYYNHAYKVGDPMPDITLRKIKSSFFGLKSRIEEGYHSFSKLDEAENELAWWNKQKAYELFSFVIIQCIIPNLYHQIYFYV